MAKKKVNLALQGGGAHGAVSWGVLDRLLEDDRLDVEAISAASAGAVNAVALAYGLYKGEAQGAREALDKLWRAVSETGAPYRSTSAQMQRFFDPMGVAASAAFQSFDLFTRAFSPYQFNPFNINPLRTIFAQCVDFAELKSCEDPHLFLAATNVRTGKIRIFRNAEIDADVVAASACLPLLFQAVEIDGEHYWDGGYMANPPLFPFFYESKTDDIVIVHVNPIEREDVPKTSSEIISRLNEISFNSSLLRELRAVAFVQKLLSEGWLKDEFAGRLRNIRVHAIRSDKALADYSLLTKYATDWDFLSTLKARGRAIAEEWLAANFDAIGARSSADVRDMFE